MDVGTYTYANPMRAPRIVKVVANIGVGEAGDKLIKAEKVIEMVTGRKSSRTLSRSANREWNLRVGMPIGVRVTMRGEEAAAFVKKALYARNNQVSEYNFDDHGNLNFGIPDYTEFEGQKYDPEIGIFGMDVAVVLDRAGGRVKSRRVKPRRLPAHHRLTREEAIAFIQTQFGIEVS